MPDVIKNVRIIDYTNNYKNSKKDRAVFAAPISISNEEYYLAAVIEIDKDKNSLYLHEVAILNKKEDDMSFKTGTVKHGTPSDISSSIYSLLNKLLNVNEGLKRPRKDNIADFANGKKILYDIYPIKQKERGAAVTSATSSLSGKRNKISSSTNIISTNKGKSQENFH